MIYLFLINYIIMGEAYQNLTTDPKLQNKKWIKQGDLTGLIKCSFKSVIFQEYDQCFQLFYISLRVF